MSGYDPEPTNDTYVIWTIGELVEAATIPEGVPPRNAPFTVIDGGLA